MYENNVKDIIKAQENDKEAMDKIVQDNIGLIWSIVKRFNGRGHDVEDLYQIGTMGFIKAIKRFDTEFEVKLSTYAVPYILGEIKRYIRDDGLIKISRSIKELGIKIKEIQREHLNKFGREININKIAEELEISKEEVAVAIDAMNPVDSIYSGNSEEEGLTILDKISNNKDEAETIAIKMSLKDLISKLDNKDKEIIVLRYYKEKTQTQVAKILGISQVQVSRAEKKILNSMKLKLIS